MSTMNKDEDHGSEAGNSNASSNSQPKKRRQPCCMRCDNHGLVIGLKQHKRYCKYQFCKCPACQLTVERQRVQARQTALKRAIEMDRSKKILPVETKPMPLDMDIYLLNLSKKQRTVKKYKRPEPLPGDSREMSVVRRSVVSLRPQCEGYPVSSDDSLGAFETRRSDNIVLNNECRAERGRSLALKSLKRKSLDAKKNRCTTKRDINVLARYCLEQLRHLSYVQPFSLAHTLLRIIDDFDECSKQDINEAMSRISYATIIHLPKITRQTTVRDMIVVFIIMHSTDRFLFIYFLFPP
ncbi:uncharacterized protein LOC105274942 isoform X2 [Ooceraea biroi]|uniref:uncharacterized protein LOC105274942 isoform X2 n=1 Tax=Ooceraea biroi TaxID=2015173 RepID=UPI0005B976D7|nr:uncharacterized protein LOC105274942 isoform X2 [Ooceraea biroi]